MKISLTKRTKTRRWMAVAPLLLCAGVLASAQDSASPSLADIARKTRKDNSAPGHVVGKQLVNEEEDGPDTTGVWRVRLCTRTPCNELSVTLPKSAKWTRAKSEPRPALILLPGAEPDPDRVIRLYVADSLATQYAMLDGPKRLFLQGWFSRPEYFGQAAHVVLDEHVQVDGANALISHFTLAATETRYRGLSIVVASQNGVYGFACVYRDADATQAGNICEGIIKSAHNQALDQGARPFYPNYQPPQYYPYYPRIDDPPINRPENDDPED
jgi:hypothetical protein